MIYTDEGFMSYVNIHHIVLDICINMSGTGNSTINSYLVKLHLVDAEMVAGLLGFNNVK